MEQVYGSIRKFTRRFLEGHRHQMRKSRVPAIVGHYFVPNLWAVDSGVHVPTPGIDSVTLRGHAIFLNRLAESEVRFPLVNPQFDEDLGLQLAHQIISEGQMHFPTIPEITMNEWGARSSEASLKELRASRQLCARHLLGVLFRSYRFPHCLVSFQDKGRRGINIFIFPPRFVLVADRRLKKLAKRPLHCRWSRQNDLEFKFAS